MANIGIKLTLCYRVSGCGQDYPVELHSDRETWQEDCCDHERFVFPAEIIQVILMKSIEFGDCKPFEQ